MKKSNCRFRFVGPITLLTLLLVCAPVRAARELVLDETERDEAYRQVERLIEVMLQVRKHYIDEKSYEELVSGALSGMLRSLDAHSAYLDARAFSTMKSDTSGHYSGIGVHIGVKDGMLTVIAPIEGTPGYRAGLLSNDRIIEIDGETTQGISLKDAVDRLRGPQDSTVTLMIVRNGLKAPMKIKVKRDEIEVPRVRGGRIIRDGVGYVRITQFTAPTGELLQEKLEELIDDGMTALVLDLRSNPGGLVHSAVDVSQKFLDRNLVVVSTRGRDGHEQERVNRSKGEHHYTDFPMAVLVNSGSASASEIVAGALQDHRRAVIVGDTTFGKGSVQGVIRLRCDRETAIRVTTAKYYTPSERVISDKGIEPDIRVYIPPMEWRRIQMARAHIEDPELFSDEEKGMYREMVDPQLERAVDVLTALRVFRLR